MNGEGEEDGYDFKYDLSEDLRAKGGSLAIKLDMAHEGTRHGSQRMAAQLNDMRFEEGVLLDLALLLGALEQDVHGLAGLLFLDAVPPRVLLKLSF